MAVCISVHMYVCVHAWLCMHTCMCVYMSVYVHVCMSVYVSIFTSSGGHWYVRSHGPGPLLLPLGGWHREKCQSLCPKTQAYFLGCFFFRLYAKKINHFWRPWKLGIKPELIKPCKASVLPTVLPLWPLKHFFGVKWNIPTVLRPNSWLLLSIFVANFGFWGSWGSLGHALLEVSSLLAQDAHPFP